MQAVLRVERTGLADPAATALVAAGSTNPSVGAFPLLAVRIAEAVGRSRSPNDGLAAIEMISRHVPVAYWAWPELQRVRAVLLWMAGTSPPQIEPVLRGALARASEIGALSLELRIAATLAELLSDEGKAGEALSMLADVMDRVTEGRDAADYQRAASAREKAARAPKRRSP
jgi:hypothetical protein